MRLCPRGRPRGCPRGRTANAHAQRRAPTPPARPDARRRSLSTGRDEATGELVDEISFAAELQEGLNGVTIEIPDDQNGGTMFIILEIHLLGFAADMLGAAGVHTV